MLSSGKAERKAFLAQFWRERNLEPIPEDTNKLLEFFLEEALE